MADAIGQRAEDRARRTVGRGVDKVLIRRAADCSGVVEGKSTAEGRVASQSCAWEDQSWAA